MAAITELVTEDWLEGESLERGDADTAAAKGGYRRIESNTITW